MKKNKAENIELEKQVCLSTTTVDIREPLLESLTVTVPGKRDHLGNFFKIELLLQQGRVGFELQNALHI